MKLGAAILLVFIIAASGRADDSDRPLVGQRKHKPPTLLIEAINSTPYYLFQWLPEPVVTAKQLPGDAQSGLEARRTAVDWIHRVFDAEWQPPSLNSLMLLRDEFQDRDTARLRWNSHGYTVEASQTATTFTIRLTPLAHEGTGSSSAEKAERTRDVAQKLFTDRDRVWVGGRNCVSVKDLKSGISKWSFANERIRELRGNNAVVGIPGDWTDAAILANRESLGDSGRLLSNDPALAWKQQWFSNIHWWNDGVSIGFCFAKRDGPGPVDISFDSTVDRFWIG